MTNPATAPERKRTCPSCSRSVRPGFKFCEFCGVKLPELGTCSNCGTQFIAPVKVCDLCGAPVVLEVKPEPAVVVGLRKDTTVPEEEAGSKPEEPEDPYRAEEVGEEEEEEAEEEEEEAEEEEDEEEGDADGEAADEPREYARAKAAPARRSGAIHEPDTDALLEKFGKEYHDEEVPGLFQRVLSPFQKKGGSARGAPASRAAGTPAAGYDALHLPDKRTKPANRPAGRTKFLLGAILTMVLIAAVYFVGLPLIISGPGVPGPTITEPTPTTSLVVTPAPTPTVVSGVFTTQPTVRPPSALPFNFLVQKDLLNARITVTFAGSTTSGSAGIRSADITVTHPDGSVSTGLLQPLKGITEVHLDGSKETDRVVIIVEMNSGETYRVYDRLIPYLGM